MSKAFRVDDGTNSFKAIIELHLERLREKFAQSCSLEELTDEVGKLGDLLSSFKNHGALLERLFTSLHQNCTASKAVSFVNAR
jgi:hypothetical protein